MYSLYCFDFWSIRIQNDNNLCVHPLLYLHFLFPKLHPAYLITFRKFSEVFKSLKVSVVVKWVHVRSENPSGSVLRECKAWCDVDGFLKMKPEKSRRWIGQFFRVKATAICGGILSAGGTWRWNVLFLFYEKLKDSLALGYEFYSKLVDVKVMTQRSLLRDIQWNSFYCLNNI